MIPPAYSLRSLAARKLTTAATVLGMALVVAVFAGVLMLARGVEETLARTGGPDRALVLRRGSTSEVISQISRADTRLVLAMPGVAAAPDGTPLAAAEVTALVNLPRPGGGQSGNVTLRGVTQVSFAVRPEVRILSGRLPRSGTSELMVGEDLQGPLGAVPGATLRFARREWRVVGVFTAGGGAHQSEIWGDAEQLAQALGRESWSSLTVRLSGPGALSLLESRVEGDPRLQLDVHSEREFYQRMSRSLAAFIRLLGLFVAFTFSLGAALGATITMFSQVAHRAQDVGILRALGFSRAAVLLTFVLESAALGLCGGLLGTLAASALGAARFRTLNFQSFSQVTFQFSMTPSIALASVLFAVLMGTLGGLWPAARAARLPIAMAARGR